MSGAPSAGGSGTSLNRGVPFLNHDTINAILTLSPIPVPFPPPPPSPISSCHIPSPSPIPVPFPPPSPSHLVLSHPIPSSSPVAVLSHPHDHPHRHPLPLSLRVLPGAKHRVYLHRRSTRSRPRLSHAGTCHILASSRWWHSGGFNTRPATGAFLGWPSWEERCWVRCQHGINLCFPAEVQMWRPRIRDLPPPCLPLSLAGRRGAGGREVR